MAFTSQGCFSPLAASLGGIVGQEVLKALTGKYTPLKQWVRIKIKNYNKDNKPLHKVGECTYHWPASPCLSYTCAYSSLGQFVIRRYHFCTDVWLLTKDSFSFFQYPDRLHGLIPPIKTHFIRHCMSFCHCSDFPYGCNYVTIAVIRLENSFVQMCYNYEPYLWHLTFLTAPFWVSSV